GPAARHRALRCHRRPVPPQAAPRDAPPVPGGAARGQPHHRDLARRLRRRAVPQGRPGGLRGVQRALRRQAVGRVRRDAVLRPAVAGRQGARRGGTPPGGRARRRGRRGRGPTRGPAAALPQRPAEGCTQGRPPARRGGPRRALPDRHGEAVRRRPRERAGAQRRAAHGLLRGPDLPHRPLPRQGGGAQHPRVPLRQRSLRADLEPQLHRPRADRRPGD
ncbi:MAG: Glucose-6-phosphate 1-dehydrogenase, partial [uncultured Friedmanniella sp.]